MTLIEITAIATPIITTLLAMGAMFQRVKTLEKRVDDLGDVKQSLGELSGKIDTLIKLKQ